MKQATRQVNAQSERDSFGTSGQHILPSLFRKVKVLEVLHMLRYGFRYIKRLGHSHQAAVGCPVAKAALITKKAASEEAAFFEA
jgi:hypothetical protein